MKILSTLLFLGLVSVGTRSDSYADESKPAETTTRGEDAQHWKFLETPGAKRKTPKPTTRPYVSGGGQAWKSRLRR
jgi:hypothetical protein